MSFDDLSSRFKAANRKNDDAQRDDKPYDHEESYRLRGKMLGVLIRDARLNASRTLEDCARLLNTQPAQVAAWEYGEAVPDLPQLELLAYHFGVPISHFWGTETLKNDANQRVDAQAEYMALRHRMIGALLRQAREDAGLSLEDVAQAAHMTPDTLAAYEVGEPIPMNVLPVLSNAVDNNMAYFLETSSYIGALLQMREEWRHFLELDEETRAFAANPLNVGFLKIALMFSKMPTDDLRKVAEGMLDITM